MTIPFTYWLIWPATGMRYYGARYANGCHPDDLGTKYFSSSKYVKMHIAENGQPLFEIDKIFESADEALLYEQKILKLFDAASNSSFLNKSNGGANLRMTVEGAKKVSEKLKGRIRSAEHSAKISKSRSGVPCPQITKIKVAAALRGKSKSLDHKMKIASSNLLVKTVKCPHCLYEGKPWTLSQHHFDNCKLNTYNVNNKIGAFSQIECSCGYRSNRIISKKKNKRTSNISAHLEKCKK